MGFPCALETQSPMGYQRRYAVVRSALRAMEADPDEDSARRWCALLEGAAGVGDGVLAGVEGVVALLAEALTLQVVLLDDPAHVEAEGLEVDPENANEVLPVDREARHRPKERGRRALVLGLTAFRHAVKADGKRALACLRAAHRARQSGAS